MANQTVSVDRNLDDAAIAGLLNGETITVDSGAVLTQDSDNRWSQQAAVIGSVTVSSVSGGRYFIDGTKVWQVPFTSSTGNVPALGTAGTQNCTGGTSAATGEFLGVWATGELSPRASGGAMPATGMVKFRSKVGDFTSGGETVTLPGGATVATSDAGKRSWLHVVGGATGLVTIPRLGRWDIYGEWYELGTTNGADDQTFEIPFLDNLPGIQVETAPGSGVYEWWKNCGARWGTATQFVSTDLRGKFFGQWKTIVNAGTTSGSAVVTTTDTTGLEVGMPVIASAGWAALSSLYITAVNPGVSFTVNTNANATSGTVTVRSPRKTVEIARRASNSCGYKPASGCKVRIPNVMLSTSISAGSWAGQTAQQTMGDRWQTLTTSAGVIDWGGVACNTYLDASAPYSVSVAGACFDTTLNVANTASSTEFDDCCVGNSGAFEATPATFSNLFTDLVLTKFYTCRYAAGAAGNTSCLVQDCANVVVTDCEACLFGSTTAVTRGNADARAFSFIRCVKVTLTRPSAIGGRIYVEQVAEPSISDVRFADQRNGTTVNTNPLVAAIHVVNTSADVFIDGFSNYEGIANVHPYAAILLTSGSPSKVEFRNLGTPAAPYDCGSANATGLLVSASVTIDLTLRRLYAQNTRTAPLSLANTVQNVVIDNVWGDGADSQAIAAVNATARGCRWTNSVSGQAAVYARHWEDAFTSTTAGRLLIACNEPLAATADQCAVTAGNPQFNSAGSVVMPSVGDQVTWEMPYFMLGVTSLANVAPTVTGTNTGNFTLEFQHDTGAGYNGTWLALTGANLNGVGAITPATGVRLKVRATTATANATNALTYIRINTVTNATDQQIQYPLPTNALATVTGISAGSRLQVYNVTTDAEIANEAVPGTSWNYAYNDGTGITDGDLIRVRLAKTTGTTSKLPFEAFSVAGAAGFSVLAQQVANTVYDTWAIDGSAQTQYTMDGTNIDIDINSGGSFSKTSLAAWWTWLLTTEDGIRDFWAAYTLEAANSIRQDVSVVDVLLQNTDVGTTVIFTDNDVRYYRSDLSIPYDTTPGFGSIFMDYSGVPLVVSTGGSALTPTESAHLLGLDTSNLDAAVSTVPASVIAALPLSKIVGTAIVPLK